MRKEIENYKLVKEIKVRNIGGFRRVKIKVKKWNSLGRIKANYYKWLKSRAVVL